MRRTLWGMTVVALGIGALAIAWPGNQLWLISFSGLLVAWSVFHLLTDTRT